MRAVVDTNVVAYFLLGTEPFVDEARRFWEAELANVVWMAIRSGIIEAHDGHLILRHPPDGGAVTCLQLPVAGQP